VAGFPWHPHRGIETITYVLAGTVAHGDSLGNRGNLGAGDVQWMTAGSGILHQEMPKGDTNGKMHGSPHDDRVMSLAITWQMLKYVWLPEYRPEAQIPRYSLSWFEKLSTDLDRGFERVPIGAHSARSG